MNKVFIVSRVWWYEGPSDNYGNCYEENILKIFDSREKAVAYIRDLIKYKVDKYSTDKFLCDEYVKELYC